MSDNTASLPVPRLATPETAVARHPATILRVADMQRWLDELPGADPARLADNLLKQLRLLVRYPEIPARYADLLGRMHPALNHLHGSLWKDLTRGTEKSSNIAEREAHQRPVMEEAAWAYMRLINQALDKGNAPHPQHLYHATLLLGRLLLVDLLSYRPLDLELWQRLLRVYATAEFYSLSGVTVDSPLRGGGEPGNLHGLFFRVLVLLLCDPHRLPLGPLVAAVDLVGQESGRLHFETPHTPGYRAIPLDLSGRRPPLAGARNGELGDNGQTRYLAVVPFLGEIANTGREDRMLDVAIDWLHHSLMSLLRQQDAREQRGSPRRSRNQPYRLLVGLLPIHTRLTDLVRNVTLPPDERDVTDLDREARERRLQASGIPSNMVNQSAGGAALRLARTGGQSLAVGDLVLLENKPQGPEAPTVGFAARIRRIVQPVEGDIEIGVQKLAGKLIPVRLVGAMGKRQHNDALLQRAAPPDQDRLFAPHGTFRKGGILEMQGPYSHYRMQMKAIDEINVHAEFIRLVALD